VQRLAILASGSGSNAEKIMEHFQKSKKASVALVASNKTDAFVLERAKKFQVPPLLFQGSKCRKESYLRN